MKFRTRTALAMTVAALVAASVAANAAGFFTNGLPTAGGSQYPSTIPLTGNETIPADTNLTGGQNPASEAITTAQLSVFGFGANPRNYLENGDMNVQQQGTGIQTCGTNTAPTAFAFAADRWFCDVNVASGAGRTQIASSSGVPNPPSGFSNSVRLYRTSGALTQPVCIMQAIESSRSIQLQGKSVLLSSYIQALAGLSSANNAVNVSVITGTGTDEGFGTLTASPAITPAWTGLATAGSATFNVTTSWVRYTSSAITIPTTATEVGVQICFTPGATGAGTTDGIALTGVQLEAVANSNVTTASAYEFTPFDRALAAAKRFFVQLNEPASGAAVPISGQATGGTQGIFSFSLPVAMRGTTPVISTPTPAAMTSFKASNAAGTATTITSATAGTCSNLACGITLGGISSLVAGNASLVTGGGGSAVITVNSDKVM